MTSRMIRSDFWTKEEVSSLSIPAKLLYVYLFSNDHVTTCGVYEITNKVICDETGLPKDKAITISIPPLNELLKELEGMEVERGPKTWIWIKKFIKNQAKNPMFLKGVIKSINQISDKVLRQKVMDYNKDIIDFNPDKGKKYGNTE